NEGGRQARRTLLRSPSSERRGKTSTAHRTSITLFGTKGKTRAAHPTSITPFGTKGEDKHGAPYFDHPLRNEGGRQARRTVLRSPSSERRGRQGRRALLRSPPSERRGKTSTAHPTSITLFGTKGEDKHGAPYFDHPLRNEGGRQARRIVLRSPSSERRGKTRAARPTSITPFGTKGVGAKRRGDAIAHQAKTTLWALKPSSRTLPRKSDGSRRFAGNRHRSRPSSPRPRSPAASRPCRGRCRARRRCVRHRPRTPASSWSCLRAR